MIHDSLTGEWRLAMADDPLESPRRLCLALPETTERLSHGEPVWFVGGIP
ncbi:hypothetical protein ACIBF6_01655 [Streptosporangium amethystogenes]